MTAASVPAPEFSRPIPIDQIGTDECVFDMAAEPHERTALAERFGLVAIDAFSARVRVRWIRGRQAIRLAADFYAEVVQTCVVTLEPVPAVLDESFEIVFAPAAAAEDSGDVVVSLEDDTEPLEGPVLDIGEVVAEELALSLDPYPRHPDAAAGLGPGAEPGAPPSGGPFAGLAEKWRKH
jgi:uncharacterized metal-binding protein YceD (DUF177 family)